MICETCGGVLEVGSWPFCPHGEYRGHVVDDTILGGFVQENFGDQPETFYSKQAMAKRADELGLQPFVRKLETTNEAAMMDPYTLASAEALVKRQSEPKRTEDLTWHSFESSVRVLKGSIRGNTED